MRVAVRLAAACMAALAGAAAAQDKPLRPDETVLEREALAEVAQALRGAQCELAVARLNDGLKARHPGVYVLAGSMYENGVCLKPNWARAERMYLSAAEAGHEGGLMRLVAGLAEGGRDLGAAMWWLQRSRVLVPDECRVPGFVADQPESFVVTLRQWAPQRLASCVYVAGVMAHLTSDVDYPAVALAFGESATVRVAFRPAAGVIEVRTVQREALSGNYGVTSGSDDMAAASRQVRSALEAHVRGVADRALARFKRPEAGLRADLTLTTDFIFRVYVQ